MKKSFQDNRYRYSRGNPLAVDDSHLRDNAAIDFLSLVESIRDCYGFLWNIK